MKKIAVVLFILLSTFSFGQIKVSVTDNGSTITINDGANKVDIYKSKCSVTSDGTNVTIQWDEVNLRTYAATQFTAPSGNAPTVEAAIALMLAVPAAVGTPTVAIAPLLITTNTISISKSNGSTDGYLTSTNWNTFNNMIPLAGTPNSKPVTGNIYFNSGVTDRYLISKQSATDSVYLVMQQGKYGKIITIENDFNGKKSYLQFDDISGTHLYTSGIINTTNIDIDTVSCTITTATTSIVGKLKIVNGSQGSGKVLTSDANGVGSWQTPATPNIQTYTAHSFTAAETYTVAANTGMVVNTNTATIASATINFSTLGTTDGQLFSFTTAGTITTLSVTGATFYDATSTSSPTSQWIYVSSLTAWVRKQ